VKASSGEGRAREPWVARGGVRIDVPLDVATGLYSRQGTAFDAS
jgi:hypothetical protein